jgi:hypothetical protein
MRHSHEPPADILGCLPLIPAPRGRPTHAIIGCHRLPIPRPPTSIAARSAYELGFVPPVPKCRFVPLMEQA